MSADLFTPADLIHVYTRAQALEDGFLVDVTTAAAEAGFHAPTALTYAAWTIIENIPARLKGFNDLQGRLWDVLWLASLAARRNPQSSQIAFRVILPHGRYQYQDFKLVCGPGDAGELVLTIMLPEED